MNEGDSEKFLESSDKMLLFSVGGAKFLVPLLSVKEIIRLPEINPLPRSPDYVMGVCFHYDQVLCVIDLARVFGSQKTEGLGKTIMVLSEPLHFLGAVVDSVEEVLGPADAVAGDVTGVQRVLGEDFIECFIQRGAQSLPLLNLQKLATRIGAINLESTLPAYRKD